MLKMMRMSVVLETAGVMCGTPYCHNNRRQTMTETLIALKRFQLKCVVDKPN